MNRRDMYTGPGSNQPPMLYREVVSRRIAAPGEFVSTTLASEATDPHRRSFDLGSLGRLTLSSPLARQGAADTWRGRGRLYGHGRRRVQFSRIEIEVSAWSDAASEVVVRPTCRHIRRWRDRRWRRYFLLAHAAADALAGAIAVPDLVELSAPAVPVAPLATAAA